MTPFPSSRARLTSFFVSDTIGAVDDACWSRLTSPPKIGVRRYVLLRRLADDEVPGECRDASGRDRIQAGTWAVALRQRIEGLTAGPDGALDPAISTQRDLRALQIAQYEVARQAWPAVRSLPASLPFGSPSRGICRCRCRQSRFSPASACRRAAQSWYRMTVEAS